MSEHPSASSDAFKLECAGDNAPHVAEFHRKELLSRTIRKRSADTLSSTVPPRRGFTIPRILHVQDTPTRVPTRRRRRYTTCTSDCIVWRAFAEEFEDSSERTSERTDRATSSHFPRPLRESSPSSLSSSRIVHVEERRRATGGDPRRARADRDDHLLLPDTAGRSVRRARRRGRKDTRVSLLHVRARTSARTTNSRVRRARCQREINFVRGAVDKGGSLSLSFFRREDTRQFLGLSFRRARPGYRTRATREQHRSDTHRATVHRVLNT